MNLLNANIGTNYKGILNLDATTINTPLDATLRAVTDGMGNSSALNLSTAAVSMGSGTITSNGLLTVKGSGSNILSLRDSSDVEQVYISNAGSLFGSQTVQGSYIRATTRASINSFYNTTYVNEYLAAIDVSGTFNLSATQGKYYFGASTSAYPMLKRNGAEINFRLADDSANCNIVASRITAIDGTSQIGNLRTSNLNTNDNATTSINIADTTGVITYYGGIFKLGGTTSSFPAIKRNAAAIDFRLADDSAYADINLATGTASGAFNAGSFQLIGSGSYYINNSSKGGRIYSSDNSSRAGFLFADANVTGSIFLQLGGSTSSFPAIKRNGAGIDFKLADDSAYAAITAKNFICGDNGSSIYDAYGTQILSFFYNQVQLRTKLVINSGAYIDGTIIPLSGTTSSFPAIKRNGAAIDFRLADDSGYCDVTANTVVGKGYYGLQADTRIQIGTSGAANRSLITAVGNGIFRITDASETDFGRLQLGGTTSSFPAIKRNGAEIKIRKADDSANTNIEVRAVRNSETDYLYFQNNFGFEFSDYLASIQILSLYTDRAVFGTGSADASARLQINSTTKGFLMPRMNTGEINAIATPANGLQVYNTDLGQPCFYDGAGWRKVSHTNM